MIGDQDAYMLTILVTDVQEDAIKDLFHCRGWKYDKNGAIPLLTEEGLHKFVAGRQPNISTRNPNQSFQLKHLDQQPQCTSIDNVTGVSNYHHSCGAMVTSSGSGTVQYNIVDKYANQHSAEKSGIFLNNQVTDLSVSVAQHHGGHTQAMDQNQFPVCGETTEHYSEKSSEINYLNIGACLEKSDTYMMNMNQKSVSGCLPPEVKCMTAIDKGNSLYHSNKEAEVTGKRLVSESLHNQLSETDGKLEEAELLDQAAGAKHISIEKTASEDILADKVSFFDTDKGSVVNSKTDMDIVSRLKESIFSRRFMVTDNGLQRYNERQLLSDIEIMCEFMKNVSCFDFDRKLIQPKLKEIFQVLNDLLEEKWISHSVHMTEKSSWDEDRELKDIEYRNVVKRFCSDTDDTGTKCNYNINEASVCDTNYKVGPKCDLEFEDTDPDASVNYYDIEAKGNTKRNLKGLGMVKRKRTNCEIVNGHKTSPVISDTTDRYFSEDEFNLTDIKVIHSATDDMFKVRKANNYEQTKTEDKRIILSAEEKVLSEDRKNVRKNESVKFRWTVNRNRRMHKYHKKCETVPLDLETDNYSAMQNGFYCPDCKFIFVSRKKLILHKRLKNGYCLPDCIYCDADEQKEVFQCAKCPKCFQTKKMLERHNDIHVKCLRCCFCELEFYTPKDLKLHIQTKHACETALKMYLCDLCGAKFKEKKVLDAHRRFVHSDERLEVCTYCNKCFKTKSQLKNHLVTHKKASELNLSCEICGKMFLRVATLKDHVRRHKKEFTCFCTICNKGFYRKYGLEEHMRVHTGDKPFSCKVCGFKCALSCNLVKHMKVHQKYNTI